jgi:hypothetical protein
VFRVQGSAWGAVGNARRGVPIAALATYFALCLGGRTMAAEPGEPAPFMADAEARPINEAATATAPPLRWKASPRVSADYVISDDATQPIAHDAQRPLRAGWNITRVDPSVRPAQYVASDPFKDPFGDRQANHNEPSLILQPTHAESRTSRAEGPPPPRRLSATHHTAAASPLLTAAQQPGGADRGRLPSGEPAMPAVGAPPPEQSTIPCPDRTYNDRNCCELEVNCRDFLNRLLADSIRNISLDITPRYNPDLSAADDEARRADELSSLGSRSWRNRRGQVIATGKMVNFKNGSVVLADESGQETARIPVEELGEDELCYVTAWWRIPAECPLGGIRTMQRNWLATTFTYHASALCHKPLYFEEVQLERYGHTAGPFRQPIISGAHFFLNLTYLPYHMAINPPKECQYPLGYYRPGNCAPWMIPPIPLSLRGATAQVATAIGAVYLIP